MLHYAIEKLPRGNQFTWNHLTHTQVGFKMRKNNRTEQSKIFENLKYLFELNFSDFPKIIFLYYISEKVIYLWILFISKFLGATEEEEILQQSSCPLLHVPTSPHMRHARLHIHIDTHGELASWASPVWFPGRHFSLVDIYNWGKETAKKYLYPHKNSPSLPKERTAGKIAL
jgi:hypothetical protein